MSRLPGTHSLVVLGAGFGADHDRHLVDQGIVKGGRQPDGLRKNGGGTSIGNTVQSLTPPVVSGYLKVGNGSCLVH